jgi:integrase
MTGMPTLAKHALSNDQAAGGSARVDGHRRTTPHQCSGVPLEQIQVLCGHDSVTTTERYVKSRWRGIVTPNKASRTV